MNNIIVGMEKQKKVMTSVSEGNGLKRVSIILY